MQTCSKCGKKKATDTGDVCYSCRPQSFTAAQIRRDASDAQILRARFPNMSKSTLAANDIPYKPAIAPAKPSPEIKSVNRVITLRGQVRGGKNAMGVTKSGRHYAKAPFKKWREEMCGQIGLHLDWHGVTISEPVNVRIDYVAGDRKRRDQTGIFDALFHLLEYAQVVTDDSLLWVTQSTRSYDTSNPGVTITFL